MAQNEGNKQGFPGKENNVTDVANAYVQNADNSNTKDGLPNVPVVETEFSSGNPKEAQYGYDIREVKEVVTGITDAGPTTQLTDYPLLTTSDRDESNVLLQPTPAASVAGASTITSQYTLRRNRTVAKPIPFAVIRGTDILYPFGASYTAHTLEGVTQLGQARSALAPLSNASGRFSDLASAREAYAYKSFGELKDAIISYRSRSIAYTNLDQADMWALEVQREGALAQLTLPLFAFKAAQDYAKMLTKRGLKYAPSMVSNLLNPEVHKALMVLYTDLAGQKTFDPTLYIRLGMFTRLHESSSKVGALPELILRNVRVGKLAANAYNINERTTGYNVKSFCPASSEGNRYYSYSFLTWVSLFLGGPGRASMLINALEASSEDANAIFNDYKIITGAIDTIESNRGAKFETIGSLLPITGFHHEKGNCFLDFIVDDTQFSYFYKERFEHAPKGIISESPTGSNNATYTTNLQMGLPKAFTKTSATTVANATFARPVGLYKGDEAWQTDEIAYVGVYRPAEISAREVANLFEMNIVNTNQAWVSGPFNGFANSSNKWSVNISAANAYTFDGLSVASNSCFFYQDAIYGDMYSCYSEWLSFNSSGSDFGSATTQYHYGDVLLLAGTGKEASIWRTAVSSEISWMAPLSNLFPQTNGSFDFNQFSLESNYTYCSPTGEGSFGAITGSEVVQATAAMSWIYTQLNLSEWPLMGVDSTAGESDVPVFNSVGYRGALWYEITLNTVENCIIAVADKFTMTYKNNAMVRADRESKPSNQPTNVR